MDDYGTEVAWAVSDPQALALGTKTMTFEFDGKMLYDQLPLTGSRAFKLVAVKIFTGNLSSATLAAKSKLPPPHRHIAAASSSPPARPAQPDFPG